MAYKYNLAVGFINLAIAERQVTRKMERSLSAIRLLEDLVILDPYRIEYQNSLALVLRNVYGFMANSGQVPEARPYLQRASDLYRHIAKVQDDKFPMMLCRTLSTMADLDVRLGNHAHSKELLDETRDILLKYVVADPQSNSKARELMVNYKTTGLLQDDMCDPTNSIENFRSALKIAMGASDKPRSSLEQTHLAVLMSWLGRVLLRSGDTDEAEAILKQSHTIIQAIPEDERREACWGTLGRILYYANEWQKAKEAFEKGFAQSPDSNPSTINENCWYFAMTLARLGERDRATELFDKLAAELNSLYNGHDYRGFRSEAQAAIEATATGFPNR